MNRTAAVLLAFLMLSIVGAPILSAHALVLPTSPWDDYWPWQMTVTYPQASSFDANMTPAHGSSAALTSASPVQTTFWANASDVFTCTMTIGYPAPASGFLEVSVGSYSKFKDFVIPFTDETTVTVSWTVTLEPTPEIPDAAQIAQQVNVQSAAQFAQLHNDNMETQDIFSNNQNTLGFGFLVLAVSLCVIGWVAYQQHRDIKELRALAKVEGEPEASSG